MPRRHGRAAREGTRMIPRRAFLATAAGGVLAGCAIRSHAAGTGVLTAADVHPKDYPTVEAVRWIGAELERETGGRLSVRAYPGGQLGAETDTISLASFNVLDMARVNVGALNNAFPLTRALVLPYSFRDEPHMRRVVDGDIGREILAGFARRGVIGLCFYDGGPRSIYAANRAVETPRDMTGLKVRVPRSDIFMEMLAAMGANATPISFGEVFTGLQTHLIDAAENNWSTFQSTRQYEVARYWSQTEHCFSPDVLLFSKARMESLSAADQELLRAKALESVPVMRVLWDKKQAAARDTVLKAGVTANQVDKDAFIRAVDPMKRRHLEEDLVGPLMRRIRDHA